MLKFIDTSRDFWKERRAVWMSPLDGQEVQASPEATTPEPEKPEAVNLDARKDEFRKKVAGAQQLIEDIKNIYVDEDEGIDQKADANDAAVNELYTKLNTGLGTITSKFETESAKDENNTAEKLQALDAQLVGEVLTTIGVNQPATDKTLDAGIKEKTVEAAQVKDVAALEKNIKDYGVEHQKDIDAFKHAEFTFTSLQNTFELINFLTFLIILLILARCIGGSRYSVKIRLIEDSFLGF